MPKHQLAPSRQLLPRWTWSRLETLRPSSARKPSRTTTTSPRPKTFMAKKISWNQKILRRNASWKVAAANFWPTSVWWDTWLSITIQLRQPSSWRLPKEDDFSSYCIAKKYEKETVLHNDHFLGVQTFLLFYKLVIPSFTIFSFFLLQAKARFFFLSEINLFE